MMKAPSSNGRPASRRAAWRLARVRVSSPTTRPPLSSPKAAAAAGGKTDGSNASFSDHAPAVPPSTGCTTLSVIPKSYVASSPSLPRAVQVRKNGKNVQALINVNAKAQFEQKYWRGVLDSQGKVDGGYY